MVGHLDVQASVMWPNDTDPCSSSDEDDQGTQDEEVIEAVKSAKLKYFVAEMKSTASSLNFMESVLLLLSNSSFAESDDETSSS